MVEPTPTVQQAKAAGWARIWQVHPTVKGAALQRKARAAAAMLAAVTVLAVVDLAGTLAGAYGPPATFDALVGAGAGIGILASYVLVRRGLVTTGVLLALCTMVAAIASYRPREVGQNETQLLYFLVVPILLGGLLVPARAAAGMAVAIVVGALAFEYALDKGAGSTLDSADASLVLLLGAVALLSVVAATFAGRDAALLDQRTDDLEKARATLETAAKERQRLFNQVAHDLANPLTPLALQVRILSAGGADAHSIDIVKRSLAQLRRQVEDLKDLARVEGGGMRLVPAACDLGVLAREAAEAFQENAKERGILLVMPQGVARVEADASRLTQILTNLMSNAVKFTPPSGSVEVTVAAEDRAVSVAVRDSGRGLTADEQALLFHPFTQVHDPKETTERGTGLGLYISRGIAEAHGGSLTVQSGGRGQGSTFTLRLPVAGPGTP